MTPSLLEPSLLVYHFPFTSSVELARSRGGPSRRAGPALRDLPLTLEVPVDARETGSGAKYCLRIHASTAPKAHVRYKSNEGTRIE